MSLKGQFLVAMPEMGDPRFRDAVVYIVGHGDEGAMGLVVNQRLDDMKFADILEELKLGSADEIIKLPEDVRDREVLRGGPVQRSRGFVLHSSDYFRKDNSYEVSDDICLTATLDILRAIAFKNAPSNALGIRRIMFAVDNIEDIVARLLAHGAELIGEMQYENTYRLAYIRGPEGIIVALAEQLG
jgi:putative AlgH/UPF0301 family transcriptional regulator